MARYIVTRYYKAGDVEYQAGQIIEITDPDYAAWLNRDMCGALQEIVPAPAEPEPAPPVIEVRAIETPPQDRMVRKAKKR